MGLYLPIMNGISTYNYRNGILTSYNLRYGFTVTRRNIKINKFGFETITPNNYS